MYSVEQALEGVEHVRIEEQSFVSTGALATPIHVLPQPMELATTGHVLLQTYNVQSDHGRPIRDGLKSLAE